MAITLLTGSPAVRRDTESGVLLAASATYTGDAIALGAGGGTVTCTVRSDQPFTVTVADASTSAGTWQTLSSVVATLFGARYVATVVASTLQPFARITVQNTGGSAQTVFEALRQVAR